MPGTIVGARSGCRPGRARRSSSGRAASRSRSASSVARRARGPRCAGVVELEPEVDRRARRGRAGHRDAASRVAHRRRRAAAIVARTSAVSASSSAGVGGSSWRWRSAWRTTPTCVETWKPCGDELGRAAADVDHEQARPGEREAVAPANVSAASSSPVRIVPSSPVRAVSRRRTSAPLAASRTADVITASARSAPSLRDRARVALHHGRARARCASSRSRPPASTPSPRRVTIDSRTSSRDSRRARRRRPAGASSSCRCRRRRSACRRGPYTVARMNRAIILAACSAALLIGAATAQAAEERHHADRTQAGLDRARRDAPTFKGKVKGKGSLWIHVCKTRKKNGEGMICHGADRPGQEEERPLQVQGPVLRLPHLLAQHPGHLLLAGPPDRVRGRPQRLPAGGPDREVQGRVGGPIGATSAACDPAARCYNVWSRRGVEQPGSSSGS